MVRELRAAVRGGQLRRLSHGVYVGSHVEDTLRTRVRAHGLRLGPTAVFSHETAAALLGSALDVDPASPLSVIVPPGSAVGTGAGLRRRLLTLGREDVTRYDGVRVTTPARTVLDLAAGADEELAVVAVDALLHAWPVALPSAVERLPALAARRGVRRVRRVLAIAEPLTESPMESRLRLLLVRAGFPRPEAQYVVRAPSGRFIARVDLAYPDLRVAVEYDGRAAHPVGLARDRERAWELRQAGWVAVHVTAPLYADRERLVARVREARREQADRLGLRLVD